MKYHRNYWSVLGTILVWTIGIGISAPLMADDAPAKTPDAQSSPTPSPTPTPAAPSMDAELKAFLSSLEPDFKEPKKPVIAKDRAIRGKRSAPIMLVEFSDFQCPYCQRGYTTVEELMDKYKNKIAFVFKNLPLPFHPLALPAAKRFVAISLQSAKKAYAFHDEVFKNQQQFTSTGESYLDDVAKKLKVNMEKMKKDMEGKKVSEILDADRSEAGQLEFTGTPGFVVNGVRVKGAYPTVVFEQIIDRELAEKAAKKGKKAKKG